MSLIRAHSLLIACVYGIVAALALHLSGTLRRSTIAHSVYLLGLMALLVQFSQVAFSGVASGGGIGVVFVVLIGVFKTLVILGFNSFALYCTGGHFVGKFGRALIGDDQIVYRKTYDRAAGAEARREFEKAAGLYREEIDKDPKDSEAYKRLADVLIRCGRPEEAVREFEKAIELCGAEDEEERCQMTFRLAEVHQDELHNSRAAQELYEKLVRECPNNQYAQYAKARLESPERGHASGQ